MREWHHDGEFNGMGDAMMNGRICNGKMDIPNWLRLILTAVVIAASATLFVASNSARQESLLETVEKRLEKIEGHIEQIHTAQTSIKIEITEMGKDIEYLKRRDRE